MRAAAGGGEGAGCRRHAGVSRHLGADGGQAVRARRRGQVARPSALGRREAQSGGHLPADRRAPAGARRAGTDGAVSPAAGRVRARARRSRTRTASASRSRTRESISQLCTFAPTAYPDRAPILVQVNGLDSTKEMRYRVGLPAWLARARRLVAGGRSARHRRGAPPARHAGSLRQRTLGQPHRRLAGNERRRGSEADRDGRRVARRLLLPARRRVRAALRVRRGLGRQSRLARRAEEAPRARRQFPGAALLGTRVLGLGRQGHGRVHGDRRAGAPRRSGRAHHACRSS